MGEARLPTPTTATAPNHSLRSGSGQGLKIRRIGPEGTTRYYYDGIRPIWEADGAGSMTAQLDRDIFGNLLSRKEPAGSRRYYHFDGLGSTTALSDEGGATVATLLYDAWGNQRASSGAAVPNYRFTGAELDLASGLYHMGARFYDSSLGRWLSEDPYQEDLFNPLSLSFYTYVLNNPLILTDPGGLQACDAACLAILNQQRQQAAVAAWPYPDAVELYRLYLELSRSIGHEAAMRAIFPEQDSKLATVCEGCMPINESVIQRAKAAQGKPVRIGDWIYRAVGGLLVMVSVGFGTIVVYELQHNTGGNRVLGILSGAGAAFVALFTGWAGIICLVKGAGCERGWGLNWP